MKQRVAEKPMDIQMQGYEVVEKIASRHATTGRILVPRHWIGKKVRAVRLEPINEEEEKEA
jgi:putative transposon-encoded protein